MFTYEKQIPWSLWIVNNKMENRKFALLTLYSTKQKLLLEKVMQIRKLFIKKKDVETGMQFENRRSSTRTYMHYKSIKGNDGMRRYKHGLFLS